MLRALLKLSIVCATVFVVATASAQAAPGPAVSFANPVEGSTIDDSADSANLSFSNLVDASAQHCRLDDAPYTDCLDVQAIQTVLRNGDHRYYVRTLDSDNAIHVDVVNFTVDDQTAPTMNVTVVDGSPIADRPRFEIELDDQYAIVYARIGGRGPERFIAHGSVFTWAPESIPTGSFSVSFTAFDPAMNAATQTVPIVNNDNVPPTIAITNPTADADLPNGNLESTFTTDDPNARYTCSVDGGGPEYCDPNSPYAIEGLSDGAHDFTVTGTDSSGNTSSVAHSFTVLDSSVAGLTIVEPAGGGTFTAEPRLAIDSGGLLVPNSLRCSVNGAPFKYCDEGQPVGGITHNGVWDLVVRGTSTGGERLQAQSTFTVNDTTPPDVSMDPGPVQVDDIDTFMLPGSISDTFSDGTSSDRVSVRCAVDNNDLTDCLTAILGPLAGVAATLTPGDHTVHLEASDWVGNSASSQTAVTIADNDAPTVTILSPAEGATVSGGGVTVEYRAIGGQSFNDTSKCQIDSQPAVSCSGTQLDGVQSWTPTGLTPGAHTITVSHADMAGNVGTATVSITVTDVAAPMLEFRSPAAMSVLTDRISLAFTTNEKIARLRCAVDNTDQLTEDSDQCDMDDATRRTGFFRPTTVGSGPRTLYVEVYDVHGNSATYELDIVVSDTTPPDIRFDHTIYRDGSDGRDTPAALSYSSTDLAASFTCSYDGGASYPCGIGRGSTDLPPAANGTHELAVTATDPSGNSATRFLEYVVNDTTAPDLDVSGVTEGMAVGASVTADVSGSYDASLTCAIDAGLYGPCGLGYVFNFTTSGSKTLRFRATDPAGNQTNRAIAVNATVPVDPGPTNPPANPPASPPTTPPVEPPAQGKGSFTKSKVSIKKKKATLAYALKITLPTGVSAANVCTGTVDVALTKKKGRKTISIAKQKAALKPGSGACTIVGTLRFKSALITKSKWTLSATYAGSAKLAQLYTAKAGKTGKTK